MIAGGKIWIQGAGDLASACAVRLVRCRYRVVMAEMSTPLAVRRLVSFCEAVFTGPTRVEGVPGTLVSCGEAAFVRDVVQVIVDPQARRLAALNPSAVIDARMTKRTPVSLDTAGAPLIGLGPGFVCPENADLVVETHRQARLGAVIDCGGAARDTHVPGEIAGATRQRVVRSPASGHLVPLVEIGDLVTEGQLLGHVGQAEVRCRLTGLLRGLVHPRAELIPGTKVADIDPRGDAIDPLLVSDKGLAIAGGVLEALLRLGVYPTR